MCTAVRCCISLDRVGLHAIDWGIVTNYTEDKGRQGFSTGYRLAECQMHLVRSMKAALYNYSILGKLFALCIFLESVV